MIGVISFRGRSGPDPDVGVEAFMIECREHPRIPIDLKIYFSTIGNTDIREGTLFNISAGGCAVISTASVSPGTGIKLLIHATDLGSSITVHSAAVRWARHGEFGVEFLSLTDLDRSRFNRLLRVVASRPLRQS